MGGKRKDIKNSDPHRNRDLFIELKILNVTIREVKASNRVNVKRYNILVNYRVQFFLFPENLKFLNTFLDFLIIPIKLDLDLVTKPEKCQTNGLYIYIHV